MSFAFEHILNLSILGSGIFRQLNLATQYSEIEPRRSRFRMC